MLLPLLLSITYSPAITQAQQTPVVAPTGVQEMAFMRAGPNFYVQGGKVVRNTQDFSFTSQLFALDVSTSWSTDSPPWKSLASGPTYSLYNGVAAANNKTLITIYQNILTVLLISHYSVDLGTWAYTTAGVNENLKSIRPVLDPTSGLVYINGQSNMVVLNPMTSTVENKPIAPTTMVSRLFPGAVYHPGRRSILYMGGFTMDGYFEPQSYITEYIVATNLWGSFTTTGALPPPRADHCMTINEDSSKIVVFGGRVPVSNNISQTTFTGTIYILDVAKAVWTQGVSSSPRLYMACTIVGDQFLAWGGYDGVNTINGPPIVYSLSSNTWVNKYTAPAYYASIIGPSATTAPGTSPSSPPGVYLVLKRRADKAEYEASTQQRIISQAEMANNKSTPSPHHSLTPPPTPPQGTTTPTAMSQHPVSIQAPHASVTRNPQGQGNDYDPVPHPVVIQPNGTVVYIPPTMSAAGYHYPVPPQSPGAAPTYSQTILMQAPGVDPLLQQQQPQQQHGNAKR
ncbi:hypothetical protein BGX23_007371 [Mortierella sp. AD031]|nr:hypothetical protein BGX23_007371 [Mortierella sp. AD031]